MTAAKKQRKAPVVRKGQKKPYRKATQQEIDARIEFVASMLSSRSRKAEIHKQCRKKFNVEWRMADYYITRAREIILERLRETKEIHRSKALALYEKVIHEGTPREATLAQERIDKLLGLEQPRALNIGGIEGSAPIKISETRRYDPRSLDANQLKNLKTILQNAKIQKETGEESESQKA
jgi:hypothetical protein